MHILRESQDGLVAAETRRDGSVRVSFYELREYIELTSSEFEALVDSRLLGLPVLEPIPCSICGTPENAHGPADRWDAHSYTAAKQRMCMACGVQHHPKKIVLQLDCLHWLCEACIDTYPACVMCQTQGATHA